MNLRHPLLKLESSLCLPSVYPTASLAKSSSKYYCPGGVVSFAICCIFCHHHIWIFNSFYSSLLLTIFSVKEGIVHFRKNSFFVRVCISMGLNGSKVLGLVLILFCLTLYSSHVLRKSFSEMGHLLCFVPFFPSVPHTHQRKCNRPLPVPCFEALRQPIRLKCCY